MIVAEIKKFIKTFKRKPTEAEIKEITAKITLNLEDNLKQKTLDIFREGYEKEAKSLSRDFSFGHIDEEALVVLSNQDVLSKSYSDLSNKLVNDLNGVIQRAYRNDKGLSLNQMVKEMKEIGRVAEYKAERIARTEMSKVSTMARVNSYKKEGNFEQMKFKHIGPDDNRTTIMSRIVKEKTKGGVSWDEYYNIIKDVAAEYMGSKWTVDYNFPITHPQTRHSFIKVT